MGSIKEKLEYLNETKRDIRYAIRSRGVEVLPEDTFRSYAQKIMDITADANLDVSPFEITQNGTYEADEGTAYNPVSVNVEPNLIEKTISKPGNYKAKDDQCDGYSKVTVDVSDNLKVLAITKTDIGDLPEKKTFKIKDSGIEDAIGYEEVIINCTAMVGSKSIDIEPTKYGTENTYVASEENIYGWHTFVINMSEDSGPFTVKYYLDSTLLYEETVQKGGSGYYVGDVPSKPRKIFKGWDPEPINVQRNLACFALFDDEEETADADGNITEDWDQISRTKGADLEVGSKRTLYGGSISYDGFDLSPGWSAECKLVGKNKDPGSTTTWAFTLPICGRFFIGSGKVTEASGPTRRIGSSAISGGTYEKGDALPALGYFNSSLPSLMEKIEGSMHARTEKKYGQSASIVSAIRGVSKQAYHYIKSRADKGEYAYDNITVSGVKLFLPSYRECTGRNDYEHEGPVYSGVGAGFYRTVSSFSAYYNGEEGGSHRPWEHLPQGKCLTEVLNFYNTSPNWDYHGYAFVDEDFNDEWKKATSPPRKIDYWDSYTYVSDRVATMVFNSITVCFCL